MDHARSASPAVQAQLDRLAALSPGRDILGLERIAALLARLGGPHHHLPPVFHVAGTNGKGSTCAFLRAALEAAGHRVHVYTSPHLVRFNERIRLAGTLIEDEALAALLGEVLDVAHGIGPSFFEVTTAAAFLAFERTHGDACVIEVGLGGRLDATNVIPPPVACGIAQLGIDHQAFLGDNAVTIAGEKAGIAKAGSPLVTMAYAAPLAARVAEIAAKARAPVFARGADWNVGIDGNQMSYWDAKGAFDAPCPALPGSHQTLNAGLAMAMLRHQSTVMVPEAALIEATRTATWPARLQRLSNGPLTGLLSPDSALWLDGGHNPAACEAIAAHFALLDGKIDIVLGMLANKDPAGLLEPFAGIARSVTGVPVRDHDHHGRRAIGRGAASAGLAASWAESLQTALTILNDRPRNVLIFGSLYLAGEALAANGEPPD